MSHLDVGGIYREAARRSRITAESEIKTAENNYWFMQPTLDEIWSEIRGGMDGFSASINDPDDLTALCWFHHHIVIHQRGLQIYRHPNHGRIRF